MKLVVIDLGCGNIGSLSSALDYLGAEHVVTSTPEPLESATHVILPGVGAFDSGMQAMDALRMREPLQRYAASRSLPVLGVCLGMQLLFEGSEEGAERGLGLLRGRCVRLHPDLESGRKVPHVGFSKVSGYREEGLFSGLGPVSHFYFTHSFAVREIEGDPNVGVTDHAAPFVAAFQEGVICGVQFHPEKSQSRGLRVIANFLSLGSTVA